jgi:hypothetical protein
MKLELIVPTELKDIPLKSYQEFVKMRDASNDEDFVAQKMIEIFCGIELKDVVKMRLTDVDALLVSFGKIFSEKPKFQHRFTLHGIEYGFIPKLEDISFEEFTNIEQLMKSWDTLHLAMAVMYRPITLTAKGKYEIMPYSYSEDMGEIFKYCPLDIALSARVFFWNLAKELLNAIPSYLEKEILKNPTLAKEVNSLNNGDGMRSIMRSLTESLKTLDTLENENLLRLSLS